MILEKNGDEGAWNMDGTNLASPQTKTMLCIGDLSPGSDAKSCILESVLRIDPKMFNKIYAPGQKNGQPKNRTGTSVANEPGHEGFINDMANCLAQDTTSRPDNSEESEMSDSSDIETSDLLDMCY